MPHNGAKNEGQSGACHRRAIDYLAHSTMADRLCGKTPLRQGDCGLFAVEWPRRTGRPLPRPPAQDAWSMSQEPCHTETQRNARPMVFFLLGLNEMKSTLRPRAHACPIPPALAPRQTC